MKELPHCFGVAWEYADSLGFIDRVDYTVLNLNIQRSLESRLLYSDFKYDWQKLNMPLYLKNQAELEAQSLFEEFNKNLLKLNTKGLFFN